MADEEVTRRLEVLKEQDESPEIDQEAIEKRDELLEQINAEASEEE